MSLGSVASLLQKLKATPIWLVAPSLLVALGMAATVSGYTPLEFDPSLYQTQSALASELTSVDAEAMEKVNSESVGGDAFQGEMQDGTWTGYAPCGEGNPDNWQPYYVAVTIEVKDKKITRIVSVVGSSTGEEGSTVLNWDPSENQEYLNLALDGRGGSGVRAQLDSQIAESGTVTGVDTVSGATYSSYSIYNALMNAMRKAAGQSVGATSVQANANAESKNVPVDGASAPAGDLADGTWVGYAACGEGNSGGWKPYYVAVSVTVKDGKVVSVSEIRGSSTGESGSSRLNWDASENQKYLSWAQSGHNGNAGVQTQINAAAKAGKSLSSIDTVSGATYSSIAIYNAYAAAINKSAKAAGNAPKATTQKDKNKNKKKKKTKVSGKPGVSSKTKLADGTYTGYHRCTDNDQFDYYLAVDVTVKNGKVTKVGNARPTMSNGSSTLEGEYDTINDSYLDWAIKGRGKQAGVISQIMKSVKAGKVASSIDAVSGATYSSKSILQAYYDALNQSAKKAGSTASLPVDKPGDQTGTDDPKPGTDDPKPGADDPKPGTDDPKPGTDDPDPGTDPDPDPVETVEYADGTYTSYAYCEDGANRSAWDPYYIGVTIEVSGGKVTSITDVFGDTEGVVDPRYKYLAGQNKAYLDRAIKGYGIAGKHPGVMTQVNKALGQGTVPTSCDTISGATYSSLSIMEAFQQAVQAAKDAAAAANAQQATGEAGEASGN